MSSKTKYHYPDGSVTFDPTLIITGDGNPSRIEQLERENAALLADNKRLEEDRRYLFYRPEYVAIEKLQRENAALRELLHRSLHWLDDYDSRLSGSAKIADDIKEALRKEAQP